MGNGNGRKIDGTDLGTRGSGPSHVGEGSKMSTNLEIVFKLSNKCEGSGTLLIDTGNKSGRKCGAKEYYENGKTEFVW